MLLQNKTPNAQYVIRANFQHPRTELVVFNFQPEAVAFIFSFYMFWDSIAHADFASSYKFHS
jgi:hypothetical protein